MSGKGTRQGADRQAGEEERVKKAWNTDVLRRGSLVRKIAREGVHNDDKGAGRHWVSGSEPLGATS
jgi:hypothetical protein